jgi:hypothetical protein
MMRRRGLLGLVLAAPAVVATAGVLMPTSPTHRWVHRGVLDFKRHITEAEVLANAWSPDPSGRIWRDSDGRPYALMGLRPVEAEDLRRRAVLYEVEGGSAWHEIGQKWLPMTDRSLNVDRMIMWPENKKFGQIVLEMNSKLLFG